MNNYACLIVEPSMSMSICDFNLAEYPGIVFSKRKSEAKITKEGGEIVGEGIRLVVPRGAVPEGDEANISLQACLGGPFNLPKNMFFVSPIFLIEPPFAFRERVTLSIDLFMEVETDEDCNETVFVTSPTKGVMKEENAQWNLKPYGSPNFKLRSRHGEIELTHFCFGAFARRGMLEVLWSIPDKIVLMNLVYIATTCAWVPAYNPCAWVGRGSIKQQQQALFTGFMDVYRTLWVLLWGAWSD